MVKLHRWNRPFVGFLLAIGVTAGAMGGTISAAGAGPSKGLNLLPTTTTVVAAPNVIVTNTGGTEPTTLSALVDLFLVHGLLITPSGTVTFTASATGASPGDIALGSAPLSSCLLTACSAQITTTALHPAGTYTVTASYGGDLVAKGSSGTTTVYVVPADSSGIRQCASTRSCRATSSNADESASISVSVNCTGNGCNEGTPPPGTQTLYAGFGYPTMGTCPGGNSPTTGSSSTQNGVVNTIGTTAPYKTVTYELFGASAQNQDQNFGSSICWATTHQFPGAVFNPAIGDWEGVPPACNTTLPTVPTNMPCFDPASVQDTYVSSTSFSNPFVIDIITAATDPGPGHH
jgi:hypothetical protein